MRIDRARILILNHNGRRLLEECLPSVVRAARRGGVPCGVSVVDNASTDDSLAVLARRWPEVTVHRQPNRGLASFNEVLAGCPEPAVLLLNSDVKLAADAVGPLLDALERHDDALFAAPQCWTFDGRLYEGMRTRVRSRFGLVQGLCRVPGHLDVCEVPDLTAAAGPVLAVDRRRFLELGGFDPIYFPGRLEDLDLGLRGWMRGWRGYYVPASMAYHKGMASFGAAFGESGCDRLAWRNTLLFCWTHLDGRRLVGHAAWLPVRLAYALLRGRAALLGATVEALSYAGQVAARRPPGSADDRGRRDAFFAEFAFSPRGGRGASAA